MPTIDYIVIFIFTSMILVVGLAFTRSGYSMKSFFAAGGALPWWLSGLSLFMSFFSAGTFVVWGSIAYKYGWVAITIQWTMAIGGFVIGFFIAPKWRALNILTVGEFIGKRFGPRLKKFYSYVFLLLGFVTTGAFLYPVAKLFNVSTGWSIELSIILLGLLVILYTAAGGLWAVIVTDVLQFVILFAAVAIVVPLALGKLGGIDVFVAQTPAGFFDLVKEEYSLGFCFAILFYNIIFIGGNWAYVQRYTSVASRSDAKKVAWLFGVLYVFSPILWMLPAMIYRTMNGDLAGLEDEGAFLLMCKEVLPKGFLGLMLGGLIFATASSVNTTLNMSAAVFTNDIYKRLRKEAKPAELLRMARISTLLFGLITIGFALLVPHFGGIVEVVLSVGAITGAPLFAPTIWALFSHRQTSFSIVVTTLLGLAINLVFKFITPTLLGLYLDRAAEMLVGVFVPIGILALFEVYYAFTQDTLPATPEPTDGANHKAIDLESSQQNLFALKVLGLALVATSLLIGVLGLLVEDTPVIVLVVAFVILLVGLALRYLSKRNRDLPVS